MKKPAFLFILFFNILFVIKSLTDFTFDSVNKEQVLYIDNFQGIIFTGVIELLQKQQNNPFYIYTFSSPSIEEDAKGEYSNYIAKYELQLREKINIPYDQKYLIFTSSGFVSFGAEEYTNIYLNKKIEFQLSYEFNNKYYQLSGYGNTIEIFVSDPKIIVYVGTQIYCTIII